MACIQYIRNEARIQLSVKDDIIIYACKDEIEAIAYRFFDYMVYKELYACKCAMYDRTTMARIKSEDRTGFDILWNDENTAMRYSLINSRYSNGKHHRLIGKDTVDFNGHILRTFVEENKIALKGLFELEESEMQHAVLNMYILMFLADAARDFVNTKQISTDKVLHLTA